MAVDAVARLLPDAVAPAREHFIERRNVFEKSINAKLEDEVSALDEFRDRRLRQLELDLSQSEHGEQLRRHRADRTRQEVEEVHDEYLTWIEETMTTEPHPWVSVVCAMTPLAS